MAKILVVGYGAISQSIAHQLCLQHSVMILKRQAVKNPVAHIDYIYADITDADTLLPLAKDFDYVFCIVSSKHRQKKNYQQLYEHGITQLIRHFYPENRHVQWFFVSSTRVYAQQQGEWVDEHSIAAPSSAAGRYLLSAEQRILQYFPGSVIVRFSGIYGGKRRQLIQLSQSQPSIQESPPYYTNRIHEQDCIAMLLFLFSKKQQGEVLDPIYLGTDDKPVTKWEVVNWLASYQGFPPPLKMIASSDSPQNKRCSNKKIKSLGFSFKYADFTQGYVEL